MLAAARGLFLDRGFEATRVADIVDRSGGSFANIYTWFGSKSGVFEAVVLEIASEVERAVDALVLPPTARESDLRQLGVRFLELALGPRALAWYRLAVREGTRFPALRDAILGRGVDRLHERLAALLEDESSAPALRRSDARVRAKHFCALLKSEVHFAAVCGAPVDRSPQTLAAQAKRAVAAFFYGHEG